MKKTSGNNAEIKKAIVLTAGLGTRFLPLSKVLPKEFWPLVDKPVLQYILEELTESGIKEIVFVAKPSRKGAFDYFNEYFKKDIEIEKYLKERKKTNALEELKRLEEMSKRVKFSRVYQKQPLGNAHAVLQAEKAANKEPCAVMFSDDIVDSKIPCLSQMIKVFQRYQRPVIALAPVPSESIPNYGIVEVEKITKRLYKIKRVVEKPQISESPSNLAIVGKYIITPDVFGYIKKTPFNIKTDKSISEIFNEIIKDGQAVYGYEFEGKWLECGNKSDFLKSNLYLSLKNPQFKEKLKEIIK